MPAPQALQKLTVSFSAGERIFTEGEFGTTMFIVQSGRVRLFRVSGGQVAPLAEMEKGDFFGEMNLLEATPRAMCAEAVEDTELIEINSTTFDRMIRSNIEIAVRLLRKLSSRLERAELRQARLPESVQSGEHPGAKTLPGAGPVHRQRPTIPSPSAGLASPGPQAVPRTAPAAMPDPGGAALPTGLGAAHAAPPQEGQGPRRGPAAPQAGPATPQPDAGPAYYPPSARAPQPAGGGTATPQAGPGAPAQAAPTGASSQPGSLSRTHPPGSAARRAPTAAPAALRRPAAATPSAGLGPRLTSEKGDAVFPLGAGDLLLGRYDPVTETQPEVDLTLIDIKRSVSRRHARIRREADGFHLTEEVGALNGTFVNGARLITGKPIVLKDGDRICVGNVNLIFRT